jgi:hypothetical protein
MLLETENMAAVQMHWLYLQPLCAGLQVLLL